MCCSLFFSLSAVTASHRFNENKGNEHRTELKTFSRKHNSKDDTPLVLLHAFLSLKNPLWKNENGKNDSSGVWSANSTFPVFLMDNIRLCSPGKGTPVSWLHKETGCPRTGYLNVPPMFFLSLCLNEV